MTAARSGGGFIISDGFRQEYNVLLAEDFCLTSVGTGHILKSEGNKEEEYL